MNRNGDSELDEAPALRLAGVRYRHPDADEEILRGVDLELRAGERVSLLGPNGSGKTTILRLLVGLIRPAAGSVFAFGRERRGEKDFFEVRAKTGYLFQNPDEQLFCATALEDVAFGPMNLGWSKAEVLRSAEAALDAVGLRGLENKISSRLSGGERRLLSLACVLSMRPEILLLDEPSAGLDSVNSARLLACLKSCGKGMLIASHDKDFLAALCARSLRLANGRLT